MTGRRPSRTAAGSGETSPPKAARAGKVFRTEPASGASPAAAQGEAAVDASAAQRSRRPGRAVERIGYLAFTESAVLEPPPLVVISGKESGLAAEARQKLVEQVLPDESLRPLNLDVVSAPALDGFASLGEKLATLPFLAARRMVILRDVIELRNEDRIALRDAIPKDVEHAVLVIDDAGIPKPQRGRAPKDKVTSLGFTEGHPHAWVIDTDLDERQREAYVERLAKRCGVAVEAAARHYLAALESADEIRNAVERLSLVTKKITKDHVEDYVQPPGDPKLWDLGNAVARGDVGTALRLARDMTRRSEEAIGPLIWLAGDAQIAWELSHGASPQAWAAATGQSPFRAFKLIDVARRRSPARAREAVRLTMRALEDAITGKRLPDQALEEVIVRLAGRLV